MERQQEITCRYRHQKEKDKHADLHPLPPESDIEGLKRKEDRIRSIKLAEQIEAIMRSEPDKHVATDAYTMARSFFFQK